MRVVLNEDAEENVDAFTNINKITFGTAVNGLCISHRAAKLYYENDREPQVINYYGIEWISDDDIQLKYKRFNYDTGENTEIIVDDIDTVFPDYDRVIVTIYGKDKPIYIPCNDVLCIKCK